MKKIGKIIMAAAILFGFGATAAFAQEEISNRNAIGVYVLGADNTIGGIQYEHRFTNLISTKINTYIYYTGSESSTYPMNYNVDAEVDFTLYEDSISTFCTSRLFVYALAGNTGNLIRPSTWDDEKCQYSYGPLEFQADVVLSAGFGFDFVFFKHLSMPCQFGFMGNFPYDASAGFCGGMGLRYSW